MNEQEVRKALKLAQQPKSMMDDSHALVLIAMTLEKALKIETKFYRNQPVLVRNLDSQNWSVGRHFSGLNRDMLWSFVTTDGNKWGQCKPDPEAESIINWIEHDGDDVITIDFNPEKERLYWIRKDGEEGFIKNGQALLGKAIARYAIIPLPEFL